MTQERPVTRSELETVAAAVRQAVAAGKSHVSVEFGGAELLLERTDTGELTLRSPTGEARVALFFDVADRPAAYPAELPFVAGGVVTIEASEGRRTVAWWAPSDPERLADELHAQTTTSGWTPEGEAAVGVESGLHRRYAKGEARRFVMVSGVMAVVTDREGASGGRGGAACSVPA